MTKQETFKRRVRQRMSRTGERYAAARRVLIEQASAAQRTRIWAADPESGDEAVRNATGAGWDAWCDRIDAWEGRDDGHTAIAAHLQANHGLDGWWAQQVTGGYERITGRRLPGQMPDGTFTANKSRTVSVDAAALRTLLLSDTDRLDLFPGMSTELRSKPTSKELRIGIGPGIAKISLSPKADGRIAISIQHEKLPESNDVAQWKHYWTDWLDAVETPD